jgi:hypothetical protein
MADSSEICVLPLSSPFSILPRAHTYTLIVALVVPLPQGWLFRAALAAFTTRTAIDAVDAAVLLAQLRDPFAGTHPLPLDAIMVLEALSLAVLVASWLLLVAKRETAARPLIRAWAVVVGVGCILAFVAVARLGRLFDASGPAGCREILVGRPALFGGEERVSVLGIMGSRIAFITRRVGIPGLIFASLAIIAAALPQRKTAPTTDLEKDQFDVVMEKGGPWTHLNWALATFNIILQAAVPAMTILVVVSTEQFVFGMESGLPSVEPMTSVGQWGIWAATGVIVLATFVNAVREDAGLSTPTVTLGAKSPHTATETYEEP